MSTPAWSSQLFLRINRLVGRSRPFDIFMIFCAHYVIWVLFIFLLLWWWAVGTLFASASLFAGMFASMIALSYIIALIHPRARPVRQLTGVKTLIHTFGTWKSFPSDHTIGATLLAYGGYMSFVGLVRVEFIFVCALVALGRVWVGVHYPRDILGGFLVASVVILLFRVVLG